MSKKIPRDKIEDILLNVIMALIKQQETIDTLIENAREPSLFKGDWQELLDDAEEAKAHIGKSIREILPQEAFDD